MPVGPNSAQREKTEKNGQLANPIGLVFLRAVLRCPQSGREGTWSRHARDRDCSGLNIFAL